MDINFDPTVNVGIKYSQKARVLEAIEKYQTVNKFIQEAVEEKLKKLRL